MINNKYNTTYKPIVGNYPYIVNFDCYDKEDKCECGSFKALGIGKGKPGHSSWCNWSINK